jgi:hypothetical protein
MAKTSAASTAHQATAMATSSPGAYSSTSPTSKSGTYAVTRADSQAKSQVSKSASRAPFVRKAPPPPSDAPKEQSNHVEVAKMFPALSIKEGKSIIGSTLLSLGSEKDLESLEQKAGELQSKLILIARDVVLVHPLVWHHFLIARKRGAPAATCFNFLVDCYKAAIQLPNPPLFVSKRITAAMSIACGNASPLFPRSESKEEFRASQEALDESLDHVTWITTTMALSDSFGLLTSI